MPSCMAEEVALGLHIDKDTNLITGTNLLIKPLTGGFPEIPRSNRTAVYGVLQICCQIQSTPTPDSAMLNARFRESHYERR